MCGTFYQLCAKTSECPSGYLVLTRNQSVQYNVDALLDLPAKREFNKRELVDEAGVSRQSVQNHIDLLVGVGLLEEVEGTRRFRFNPESRVSQAVM